MGFDIVFFVVTALVALFGALTQIIPGPAILALGTVLWAAVIGKPTAWVWVVAVVAVLAIGTLAKFAFPSAYLKREGISTRTLLIGAVAGVAGFFAVPFFGLFLGFPLGVYLAEARHSHETAWQNTLTALKGVGLSIAIEVLSVAIGLPVWAWGIWSV
ncbi:DUF456 domain-containing protein [Trueperella pecoris]|uniref:DUF456 domain-containing protein n=1 Tax=Trueperella pecoris TaxID=2733571 RepID=UPI00186BA345|nr:DUF456 domain-containing protein [Trueperella pecoris]QOQ38536.1 DUF456 domain-containing protein [Trueperella pecoris]